MTRTVFLLPDGVEASIKAYDSRLCFLIWCLSYLRIYVSADTDYRIQFSSVARIIDGNAFGLCVNPLNPAAIALAIDDLVFNPEMDRRIGESGHNAVMDCHNCSRVEPKLLGFYADLLVVKQG